MTASAGDDTLHLQLLELVFANGMTPQRASLRAFNDHPDRKALDAVFLLTLIATDLRGAFQPDDHWTYTDWLEAATSLACDVYASSRLGQPDPSLGEISALWTHDTSQKSEIPHQY